MDNNYPGNSDELQRRNIDGYKIPNVKRRSDSYDIDYHQGEDYKNNKRKSRFWKGNGTMDAINMQKYAVNKGQIKK